MGVIKMFVREKRKLIKGCREYLKLSVFFVDKRNNKHSTPSLFSRVMFALLHKHRGESELINNHFTKQELKKKPFHSSLFRMKRRALISLI